MYLDNCMNREDSLDKEYSIKYAGLDYKLKNLNVRNEWYEELAISYGQTYVSYGGIIKDRFFWLDELDVALLLNQGSNWFGGQITIDDNRRFNLTIYTD